MYLGNLVAELDAGLVRDFNQFVHAPERRLRLARDQVGADAERRDLVPCGNAAEIAVA